MKTEFLKIHSKEGKTQKRQQKRKGEGKEESLEGNNDSVANLVKLFHVASFFETATPEAKKKFFAELQQETARSGNKTSLSAENDVQGLVQLSNNIFKRQGNDKASIEQSVEQAQKFVAKSDKEASHGVSYRKIQHQVTDFFVVKITTDAKTESAPAETKVEQPNQEVPKESPSVSHEAQNQVQQTTTQHSQENGTTTAVEQPDTTEGATGKEKRSFNNRRGGRGGRGRGGRGGGNQDRYASGNAGGDSYDNRDSPRRGRGGGRGGKRGGRGGNQEQKQQPQQPQQPSTN